MVLTTITNFLSPHSSRPSRRQFTNRGFSFGRRKIQKSLLGRRPSVHTECIDLLPGMAPGQLKDWSDVVRGQLTPKWTELLATASGRAIPTTNLSIDANGIAWLA